MGLFLYLSSPYLISSVPVHYHRMPSSLFFSLYLKLLSNSEKLDSHTCKEGVDAMVFQWQWLQLVYRSWCLNIIFNYKNLGLLGGMANFRVELWDPQNEPEYHISKMKEVLQKITRTCQGDTGAYSEGPLLDKSGTIWTLK